MNDYEQNNMGQPESGDPPAHKDVWQQPTPEREPEIEKASEPVKEERSEPYPPYSPTGGYSGTPYSPNYHSNTYPPRPDPYGKNTGQNSGYNQGYPPRSSGYSPSPYQYNANSGWQPPPAPQEKYEWKFEDYEKFDGKKTSGSKQNRGIIVFTIALLCFLSVGLVGLAGYSIWSATAGSEDDVYEGEIYEASSIDDGDRAAGQLQVASSAEIVDVQPSADGRLSIPEVAESVMPSVVGVIKYDNDQYYEINGYGSGIIMSEDGYIITNAHVVAGGTGFKVQFTDGDAYDAEMVGSDAVTDLAVLKISATGLKPAIFGDSDSLRVGELVVAIGNPAGMELASSVTVGYVSAINREVQTTNYQMTYIQTDAAINPGNSGGALANEYGQVIGINSSKIVAAGYEGIGFAIPIASAKPVIDNLIQNGKVTGRVMLGVTCKPVDEIDARNYNIQMGLMIDSVEPESDLSGVGVMRGDILTHIDGERIYTLSDVRFILDGHSPGDTVTLTMYRKIGTQETTYDVKTRLLES